MNEKRTFKKRLAGLFAMAMVLSMMMGMTVNAASTYYILCDGNEPGKYGDEWSYTLCSDADYKIPANISTLSGGDKVQVSSSGTLNIKLGNSETQIVYPGSYEVPAGTYNFEIKKVNNEEGRLTLAIPTPVATQGGASCSHDSVYSKTIKEPTETEDSIVGWFCENCGARVGDEVGANSSYALFLKNAINKINNAESGSTVEIRSERWDSLTQEVMLALQARRDIHVVLVLRYQNEDYRYVIPAGAAFDTSELYYGALYLGQLFGMTKLEK